MNTITSAVKDLPDSLRSALSSHFHIHGGTILLEGRETVDMQVCADDGRRGVVVLVDIATGASQSFTGNFGGGGFERNAVDMDNTPRKIEPGFAIVKGQVGNRSYATVYLHPSNMVKLLSPVRELTAQEAFILNLFGYKSSYRKEQYAEFDSDPVNSSAAILARLEGYGYAKTSGRGMSRTVDGDNALRASEYRHVPDNFYGFPDYLARHERTKARELDSLMNEKTCELE